MYVMEVFRDIERPITRGPTMIEQDLTSEACPVNLETTWELKARMHENIQNC